MRVLVWIAVAFLIVMLVVIASLVGIAVDIVRAHASPE
jgi:hypothetical protein